MNLAEAHIEAQAAVRTAAADWVGTAWQRLPGYDEKDVNAFLALVVPLITAAQHRSIGLTNAFIARVLGRLPVGVDVAGILASIRGGVSPEEVYRRPFVTVWTALKAGTDWEAAVAQGLARATSTAATDVQLAMRQALVDIGETDDDILGYRRVPDASACDFCRLVAGQRYTTKQLMPIHNHCGCGVDVITVANRGDFTGNPENDLSVTRDGVTAEVREHGELGPVLVSGDHDFTQL